MRALLCLLAAALAAAAAPLAAQERPQPGPGDPRIQSIEFKPDTVFQIQGAPGYAVTVELAPDEQVENVAVGDSNAWQVTANHRGDHLFVKALQAVPTNMTVITNVRLYNFELVPGSPGEIAYTVRFHYPSPTDAAAAGADDAPPPTGRGLSRRGGDKARRRAAPGDAAPHPNTPGPRARFTP